ncbi:helix-turn-helix domain-containing protein [Buttiauxella sp.]|uniref:winged helix-turn-helix transcriptional regulator n=1 Tax=Buttiauxella sp. TaxID=1972222 RepID=UPI003C75E438
MNKSERFSLYTEEFIHKLSPFVTYQIYPAGYICPFVSNGARICYLVRSGSISIYRADEVLVGGWHSPCIIGLVQYEEAASIYFQTNEPCEIAVTSREEVFSIIEEHGLWQLLSIHMEFVSDRLLHYASLINAPTAYEIIRKQLLTLIDEPDSLRESITAEKYIRIKTHLSRSGVMRILSALKAGEYIVIEDGILKEIRHLPAKY